MEVNEKQRKIYKKNQKFFNNEKNKMEMFFEYLELAKKYNVNYNYVKNHATSAGSRAGMRPTIRSGRGSAPTTAA